MKKILFIAAMVITIGSNAFGQTVISNNYDSPITSSNGQSVENNDDDKQSQGGLDIMYHGVEHGWGVGFDWAFNYFLMGYGMYFGDTNDILKDNQGWEAYLGGNYRYHIIKEIYVEGRVMAGYYHWKSTIKTGKSNSETDRANEAFLGVSPRLGIDFGKWGISAGYRWDFVGFKFDKDHTFDRFNVGITIGL